MKKTLLALLLILLLSQPIYGEERRAVSIDMGSFSGFFGFSYEWLEGLSGHKLGLGIVDPQSLRIAYAYKRYFPDRAFKEEVKPSRIFIGPLFNITFEDIYQDTFLRYRLGLQMGYDLSWGSEGQYYSSLAGGFAILYPPQTYRYYQYYPEDPEKPYEHEYILRDAFAPVFTVSFGYRY